MPKLRPAALLHALIGTALLTIVMVSPACVQPMARAQSSADIAPTLPTATADVAPTDMPTTLTDQVAATAEDAGWSTSETDIAATPAPSATMTATAVSSAAIVPTPRVIAIDPGHGGPEVGAASGDLAEKNLNLAIALKLADLVRAQGYQAALTRDEDTSVSPDYHGNSYAGGLGRDLQARVDIANAANADLFICIHNNGSGDPGQSGTEVWYDGARSFGDRNLALAKLVETSLVEHIRALGYPDVERGIHDDGTFRIFQGRPYNIYVLGAGVGPRAHVPTRMPGVLGESLFLSNGGDAWMLRQDSTLDAIAAGYLDAINAYFEAYPDKLPLQD